MTKFPTPSIDWAALAPELVLLGGAAVCLLVPLFMPRGWRRHFSASVSVLSFIGAGAAAIALFHTDDVGVGIVANALERDRLAELAQVMIAGSGLLAVGVSYAYVLRERMGEYYTLLLTAAAGMCFFVGATNLMTMFLGLEWFSISLYVLCAIDRELEGSLIRLIAYASLTGQEITLPLTQEVLKNILDHEEKAVTIEIIQKHVADYYQLKPSELKSKNNSKSVAMPRQVAMYLCKSLTHASLPEIGKSFWGKHHSTVIHSIKKVEELRKRDPDFNKLIASFLDHFR